jgi:hypothetical protein
MVGCLRLAYFLKMMSYYFYPRSHTQPLGWEVDFRSRCGVFSRRRLATALPERVRKDFRDVPVIDAAQAEQWDINLIGTPCKLGDNQSARFEKSPSCVEQGSHTERLSGCRSELHYHSHRPDCR